MSIAARIRRGGLTVTVVTATGRSSGADRQHPALAAARHWLRAASNAPTQIIRGAVGTRRGAWGGRPESVVDREWQSRGRSVAQLPPRRRRRRYRAESPHMSRLDLRYGANPSESARPV